MRDAPLTDVHGIASLPALPRAELNTLWRETFGKPSPKGMSTRLLAHAIAYAYQEKRSGGLTRKQKRLLASIAQSSDDQTSTRQIAGSASGLATGTRLVREWHGKTHIVEVLSDGFIWDDRHYASLTAVASAITGTHWSGPKFFGL